MRRDSLGGNSLIIGSVLMLSTMALHPTGHGIARDAQRMGILAALVHSLGLASVPFLFYGVWVLTRRLSDEHPLAELALVVYGSSAMCAILAAAASGFLAPDLIARMTELQGAERDAAGNLLHYTGRINQAFAMLYVAGSSAAILLWSATILRSGRMNRTAGIYGVIVAALALVVLLSGHLRLDVHGFGAVVLTQCVWFIVLGGELRRNSGAIATPPSAG